ncbi:hypothetical protein HOLleu_44812 [Holothuria leucospilota]|uniref:C2H2-type domain-containing protein n=1 Tax=Holothuria leucospilota TaxID=206669 RepID=A0A9Q0YCV7_HOLLE|nr:hypothetical protein HOLleu_44812 [Holothuria leucospilota]
MSCFKCKAQFPDTSELFRHFKIRHGLYDGQNLLLKCGQGVCSRTFYSYSGLKRHLVKHAPFAVHPNRNVEDQDACGGDDEDNNGYDDVNGENVDLPVSAILSPLQLQNQAAGIICKLSSSKISHNSLNSMANAMDMLFNEVTNSVLTVVEQSFEQIGLRKDSDVYKNIESHITSLKNPFSELNTEFKRSKYFTEQGMVEPCEISLGVRIDNRLNRITRVHEQVPVNDTFIYVPIIKTLEFLMKHPDVVYHLTHDHISTDGVIRDYCDANQFKQNPVLQRDCNGLQLHFFYDDFETVNPLGSKTSIHKIGAFYFVLKNFPPKFNSNLQNIHCAALCHTEDLKKYGFDPIVKHIVADLNYLSKHGVALPDGSFKKGTLTQFSADNLGANSLFGFVESFSASHFCRICLTSKEDAQVIFNERNMQMRNKDLHNLHVQQAQQNLNLPHVQGVKRESVLNDCAYFHILSNYSLDVMHDLLEGVVQYEIKLVLSQFVLKREPPLISYSNLSNELHTYDYGSTEKSNKPSFIKLKSPGNAIGQKAMQAWCLIRHLPLMIGHLMQDEDMPYFDLLLRLLDCMDIIFSPKVTHGLIAQLGILIAEHHTKFREVFPDQPFIPKHHFMVHYPTCLREVGPLIHVWCMRYEAKHDYFCQVAESSRNFKNICKTVAKKHQISQMYHFISKQPLETFHVGPGSEIVIANLTLGCVESVIARVPNATQHTELFDANWVEICGTEYKQKHILVYDVEEMPSYGQIQNILIHNGVVYFVLRIWITMYYKTLFHAFAVKETFPSTFCVKSTHELVDFKPLSLLRSQSKDVNANFVCPRHVLFK